jgi:hypothetical protein
LLRHGLPKRSLLRPDLGAPDRLIRVFLSWPHGVVLYDQS